MTRALLGVLACAALLLAACGGPLVSDPDYSPPPPAVEGAQAGPVSNNKLKPRREPITIGTAVPLFELADQKGSLVTAAELIGKGDAVLVFSPGNAAPEARAIPAWVRDHRQAMADRGCELLIVTPDAADANASLAQTEAMRVAILSDSGRRVAAAFGLAKVNAAWVVIVGREGRVIHSEGRLPDRTELITALMVRSGAKGDSFADLLK